MTLLSSPQVILALAVPLSEATQYRRHELPGGVAGFLPRMRIGRNSKLRPDTSAEAGAGDSRDVTKLLADLKKQLAEVYSLKKVHPKVRNHGGPSTG